MIIFFVHFFYYCYNSKKQQLNILVNKKYMNKIINKSSLYYIAAKKNNPSFPWKDAQIQNLEDILIGTIFFLYKNPNAEINSREFFNKEEIKSQVSNQIELIFNGLTFPDDLNKELIKEEILLKISVPINPIKNKIFKV